MVAREKHSSLLVGDDENSLMAALAGRTDQLLPRPARRSNVGRKSNITPKRLRQDESGPAEFRSNDAGEKLRKTFEIRRNFFRRDF